MPPIVKVCGVEVGGWGSSMIVTVVLRRVPSVPQRGRESETRNVSGASALWSRGWGSR